MQGGGDLSHPPYGLYGIDIANYEYNAMSKGWNPLAKQSAH